MRDDRALACSQIQPQGLLGLRWHRCLNVQRDDAEQNSAQGLDRVCAALTLRGWFPGHCDAKKCLAVRNSMSLQCLAGGLPALLTVLALLGVQGLGQADPEGTTEEGAKDCDDDAVSFGAAVLRVIEPRAAVWGLVIRHEC